MALLSNPLQLLGFMAIDEYLGHSKYPIPGALYYVRMTAEIFTYLNKRIKIFQ